MIGLKDPYAFFKVERLYSQKEVGELLLMGDIPWQKIRLLIGTTLYASHDPYDGDLFFGLLRVPLRARRGMDPKNLMISMGLGDINEIAVLKSWEKLGVAKFQRNGLVRLMENDR